MAEELGWLWEDGVRLGELGKGGPSPSPELTDTNTKSGSTQLSPMCKMCGLQSITERTATQERGFDCFPLLHHL